LRPAAEKYVFVNLNISGHREKIAVLLTALDSSCSLVLRFKKNQLEVYGNFFCKIILWQFFKIIYLAGDKILFKETVSRDFRPSVFSPIDYTQINTVTFFGILFRIRRDLILKFGPAFCGIAVALFLKFYLIGTIEKEDHL
jgi:hypothetical protein